MRRNNYYQEGGEETSYKRVKKSHYNRSVYNNYGEDEEEGLPPFKKPRRIISLNGLDFITFGGIPMNNAVLIGGTPGAGKSLTVRQILINAITLGIPTVYYTAEEHPSEVIESIDQFFGFDVWPYIKARLLKFVYLCYSCPTTIKYFNIIPMYNPDKRTRPYEQLIRDIINNARNGYKLIIIDSVTPLWADAPSMGRKIMIMLHSAIKSSKVTALMTTQVSKEEEGFGGPGVEHASDGIIFMNTKYYEGELKRIIKIRKMRGTKHTLRQHEYVIDDGEIIVDWKHYVYGINKLFKKEVPQSEQEKMVNAVIESYKNVLNETKENKSLIQTINGVDEDDLDYINKNFDETVRLIEEVIKQYEEGNKANENENVGEEEVDE